MSKFLIKSLYYFNINKLIYSPLEFWTQFVTHVYGKLLSCNNFKLKSFFNDFLL